jgi:steroid delta-isomerase-like uncharacterized protein
MAAPTTTETFLNRGTTPVDAHKPEPVVNTLTSTLDNPSAHATTPSRILHAFLAAWWHGNVVEAAEQFGDRFTFTDHALGLEFNDKVRLTEFLAKAREFFPDTHRTDNTIWSSKDGVITEWTLTASLSEPFLGGLVRRVPIRVHGISVVQVKNGKISRWADYYDQLTARRYGLGSWSTGWIEL